MVCAAPGRLSTVMVSTRCSLVRTCWIARAMRSFSPPAPAPTTNSTLPSGTQVPAVFWACATVVTLASTAAAIASPIRIAFLPTPELGHRCGRLPLRPTGYLIERSRGKMPAEMTGLPSLQTAGPFGMWREEAASEDAVECGRHVGSFDCDRGVGAAGESHRPLCLRRHVRPGPAGPVRL